jgi:transposase-like protein
MVKRALKAALRSGQKSGCIRTIIGDRCLWRSVGCRGSQRISGCSGETVFFWLGKIGFRMSSKENRCS